MAHPNGGGGNIFPTNRSFIDAYKYVGLNGAIFKSTTGETIRAKQGTARDGITKTIVFYGERNRHGSVCESCWGYRKDCNGSRIGQCAEALDKVIP